jgi:UDP-N-acetylglucosamine transferase subunit ALG13
VIVVLIGTGPDSFERLVRPLDELARKNGWDVFIQLGHTPYQPRHCTFERFVERDALLRMLEAAELVITQGGYGGIRDALLFDKPIVAVPRDPVLHESPDYQDELVRAMEQQGYLIGVYDIGQLEAAIRLARGFVPAPRSASTIPSMLAEYVLKEFA